MEIQHSIWLLTPGCTSEIAHLAENEKFGPIYITFSRRVFFPKMAGVTSNMAGVIPHQEFSFNTPNLELRSDNPPRIITLEDRQISCALDSYLPFHQLIKCAHCMQRLFIIQPNVLWKKVEKYSNRKSYSNGIDRNSQVNFLNLEGFRKSPRNTLKKNQNQQFKVNIVLS